MGSKWPVLKFKDLYLVPSRNGLTKPKAVRGAGYKFINMGEIFSYGRMFNIPCDRVQLTEKEKQTSLLMQGDLLFARQSLVLSGAGKCSIFLGDDEDVAFESHLIRVRLDTELVNPEYLYYYFLSPQGRKNISTIVEQGAGQAGIRGSDLENLDVPVPPKKYQDNLVSIINNFDTKCECNYTINQTLEQMAQTLFKSWFVDFDPVIDNALDAGNDIPDTLQERAEQRRLLRAKADFKPLPAETRALFPSEFEETELGWVPKGWAVESLDQIANFQNGLALQKFRPLNDTDDFLPVLKISDLRQGYTDGVEKARTDIVESCRVYDGDMIFSWSGTLMIDVWTGGNAALNQHLYKVTSQKYPLSFYLYWTKHHLRRFQHIAAAKAVTMGHIKKGDLSDSLCLIPNKEILKKYNDMASNYIEQQINLRLQNNQLSEIRDLLLPKLISGELVLDALPEVPELAEAF